MRLLDEGACLRKTRAIWISLSLLAIMSAGAGAQDAPDAARWATKAKAVTITRDDWGIAHVHGKTDADAVFGMIYAQCEDDFHRVERNYLTSLGRTAEADGESAIWADLRQRLFIDPEELKKDYAASPAWLRKLMDAWADGINFYLAQHPEVKPQVLVRWEPWMALSFTEGVLAGISSEWIWASWRRFMAGKSDGAGGGDSGGDERRFPSEGDPSRTTSASGRLGGAGAGRGRMGWRLRLRTRVTTMRCC